MDTYRPHGGFFGRGQGGSDHRTHGTFATGVAPSSGRRGRFSNGQSAARGRVGDFAVGLHRR